MAAQLLNGCAMLTALPLCALIVAVLVVGSGRSVYANFYVDPGSGAYVIQLLLTGLFALLLAMKSIWRRSLAIFRKSASERQRW
jgi:hypothetical protein